jgi:hypothetical protein
VDFVVKKLTIVNNKSMLNDFYLACIEQAREQSSFILRRHFKVIILGKLKKNFFIKKKFGNFQASSIKFQASVIKKFPV